MFSGEQQLGRYRLLRLIASGGMGEIHLAEDSSINRQVAIKVIRSEIASSAGEAGASDAARLFEREAKAIAMLDHPHILPLYDYGEQKKDGTVLTYLVMPYRPEGSLANWLEQRGAANPLSLEDVEHIISQSASALQYTHDHKLIHQDVKPSNFLIRTNKDNPNRPDVLVSDFGIARLSNMTSGASQSIRGTPSYMAPEQWEGHPVPASDQYALAVMAYELLTGRSPFRGNPLQMMYAHVNTQPQAPSSINPALPPALDAVILRGLAKKPEDRFPTISAFGQALRQALRDSATSALQLSNPYASAIASTPSTPSSSGTPTSSSTDLYATLAISEAEARAGTDRVLTLPDGKKISVSIPPGAQNGQMIELSDPDATARGTSGILRLTLSVLPVQQQGNTATFSRNVPTMPGATATFVNAPERPVPNAALTQGDGPTIATHWQGAAAAYPGPAAPPSPDSLPPPSGSATPVYSGSATPASPGFPPPPLGPATPASPGLPPGRARRPSRNILLVSIAVALLLILGSAVLVYALHGSGPATGGSPSPTVSNQGNSNATGTALANAGQGAQSTATAQAQASATANAQSTAVAQSTAIAQANATATAIAANPYGGTLVMKDPLADNSQGHQWDISNNASVGTSCQFTSNAYHMVMPGNYGGACLAEATQFSNFAFQVQMTFFKYGQHFSGGGLVFRGSAGSKYYVLEIFESGQYTFYSCSGNDCSHGIAGYPAASAIQSFHLGLNQTNTIAVVANGNTFTFYANGQRFAGPITDVTYTQGMIGFYAEGGSEGGVGATTDVAYSNVKVWQL